MKKLKEIKKRSEEEAYTYFHNNIRPLPKKEDGSWDFKTGKFHNNDTDAFRHAYVSGIFTQKYNQITANTLGQLHELDGDYKRSQSSKEKNMDLWNNQVGRKYGAQTSSRPTLLKLLQTSLENGELIITIDSTEDNRTYKEDDYSSLIDPRKPMITIEENKTGRNKWFLDLVKGSLLSRAKFVQEIEYGNYPGYLIADIHNIPTPLSKPDGIVSNNLG
jgi:hypothetical protein